MNDNSVINKDDFYKFIYEVVLDSLLDRVEIIKSFNNDVQAYLSFICKGSCDSCTSKGPACGIDSFKGINIYIAKH